MVILEADLHTHSIASGHALSTIKEMAEYAAIKGLKMIAITDHGLNMPAGPHIYYYSKLVDLPEEIHGVKILKGVEANIIDIKGNLDMPEHILKRLDIVLAGFHRETGYNGDSVEDNTQALINAIKNPYVHIITHPGNPEYPVDLDQVVLAAQKYGKVLEINNSSLAGTRQGSYPRCNKLASMVAKAGLVIAINSDAHSCFEVGEVEQALELVINAGIKEEQVLNCSVEAIQQYLVKVRNALTKIS